LCQEDYDLKLAHTVFKRLVVLPITVRVFSPADEAQHRRLTLANLKISSRGKVMEGKEDV
jgi:hypothetical protein